jgi:hypothetical protein
MINTTPFYVEEITGYSKVLGSVGGSIIAVFTIDDTATQPNVGFRHRIGSIDPFT